MRRLLVTLILAISAACLPAAAHDCSYGVSRPYVVEKLCDEDFTNCKVRMIYAPGQNPGLAGHGSYWYPRAGRSVRVSPPECYAGSGGQHPHVNEDSGEDIRKDDV